MAALSVFAQITGEGRGVYDYQVLLNTQRLVAGRFDASAGDDRDATTVALDLIPQGEVSLLQFDRDGSSEGRMYYSLNLRYLTPATEIAALNRGFAVSRRYSLLDDPDTAITSATLGDVVRIEVTVVAPAERRFARVEGLPACRPGGHRSATQHRLTLAARTIASRAARGPARRRAVLCRTLVLLVLQPLEPG